MICVTLCVVLGLFLAFNYNRFDARDWQTILGTIATAAGALLGFEKVKDKITGEHEIAKDTDYNDPQSEGPA